MAQGRGRGEGPAARGSLTVTLGPDKQGHALQPLHVAGRHMPGAPVVPLPVLVECVNLHPPPGVGHRAARGPGQRPRRSRPGRGSGEGGSRGERTPTSGGLPGLTASAGRPGAALPPSWPAAGPELWPPPFLASGSSALLSRPGEAGRPEGAAQRFAASRPAALGTRGAVHCPAPASAMISVKLLPAPPPPPPPPQAAAAMFSFLIPGPATAAGDCAPLPCFKCPKPTGGWSRCSCHHYAGDSESPLAHERSWLLGVPLPPPLPPPPPLPLPPPPLPSPLPSSSQSQSRRHLGSLLNSGARGHPGSSCRGGPLAPPFKETGGKPRASQRRRLRTEAVGGRRVAELAGAQGVEDAERWSRR